MIYVDYMESPIGILKITANKDSIIGIEFLKDNKKDEASGNKIIVMAKTQLGEYFKGERKEFTVPLDIVSGTEFQKRVWKALKNIPYGKVATYKDIAIEVGNPKASRAIGNANNKNPLSVIIPCHRVIGSNGALVGYEGGLSVKKYLLELEKSNK
ncbi:methylated-DNA--[protein]-cysteine S-methyltransferase [Clostridium hydrogeniformans]|uniref:methylated-DNA--[protein]-cysteine S-methyltransferase n=1 Tax=Clostridium hydrogeniformans TaxID=349933 RepID=UPI000A92D7D8|nr:methylated-DNA--[protein]-cysteine S-methyltransferase [Clostridium hydrogeniformans]